jgi:pimeloyl-ACP methyl ester carboxylesterase
MTSSYSEGPTVVLVHGAFADAGSWAPVTQRLIEAEVPVCAIVNPLRGVKHDAAYVASVINQIDGPVLAVGHSYGGMIITNAAAAAARHDRALRALRLPQQYRDAVDVAEDVSGLSLVSLGIWEQDGAVAPGGLGGVQAAIGSCKQGAGVQHPV